MPPSVVISFHLIARDAASVFLFSDELLNFICPLLICRYLHHQPWQDMGEAPARGKGHRRHREPPGHHRPVCPPLRPTRRPQVRAAHRRECNRWKAYPWYLHQPDADLLQRAPPAYPHRPKNRSPANQGVCSGKHPNHCLL